MTSSSEAIAAAALFINFAARAYSIATEIRKHTSVVARISANSAAGCWNVNVAIVAEGANPKARATA